MVHSQCEGSGVNVGGTSVVEHSQVEVETVLSGSFKVPHVGHTKHDPFILTAVQTGP